MLWTFVRARHMLIWLGSASKKSRIEEQIKNASPMYFSNRIARLVRHMDRDRPAVGGSNIDDLIKFEQRANDGLNLVHGGKKYDRVWQIGK
ncbi:MAG: hypothetical protein ABSH22_02225 [Tepidisphaeraceae bacterium]|jgi:hypothetical protein